MVFSIIEKLGMFIAATTVQNKYGYDQATALYVI